MPNGGPFLTGEEIRHLREARQMTQEQLAKAMGVGVRTIGNWERGEHVPQNRMGRLREFFSVEDPDPSDPLRRASDVVLISELLRRAVLRDQNGEHGRGTG